MPALALTDHGVMHGHRLLRSVQKKRQADHRCEVYVAQRHRTSRNPKLDSDSHHPVLLAEDMTGYSNCLSRVGGVHRRLLPQPRVDKELLAGITKARSP
jgi:DNA polymerase III alpha subunit